MVSPNLGDSSLGSTPSPSRPAPIELSLKEIIQTLTPDQLKELMKNMSLSDLQRFEVDVLSTVKDKTVIRAFLDRKIEILQKKFPLAGIEKPHKLSFQATLQAAPFQISAKALEILNSELFQHLLSLEEAARSILFNQMSEAQRNVCLQQIQASPEEGATLIAKELSEVVTSHIQISSVEAKAQLFDILKITRQFIARGKVPLSARKITPQTSRGFFQSIGNFFAAIGRFFASIGTANVSSYLKGRTKPLAKEEEPDWAQLPQEKILQTVVPNPELDRQIEELKQKGWDTVAKIPKGKSEEQVQIEHLMGMTIADTVLTSVDKSMITPKGPFTSGGNNIRTTHLEMEALEQLFGATSNYEKAKKLERLKTDYHLTGEEIRKLEHYYQGLKRSDDINQALQGIQMTQKEVCETDPVKIKEKDDLSSKQVQLIARKLVQNCHHLQPGESLYIDMVHFRHGMRLGIKKTENHQFVISLYDNSGGMEDRIQYDAGFIGKLKCLVAFFTKSPRKMTLQLTVPENKLYAKGQDYFGGLFSRSIGKEFRADYIDFTGVEGEGLFGKLRMLGVFNRKWDATLGAFAAISPETVEFRPTLRTPGPGICYAQRLQTNQLEVLEPQLFAKFGRFVNAWSTEKILEFGKKAGALAEEDVQEILNADHVILTPAEIQEASEHLIQLKKIPGDTKEANRQVFRDIVRLTSHNVQKLKVNRRVVTHEDDPSLLPKASLKEALAARPTLDDLKDVTIVNRFDPGRVKVRNVEIHLNGVRREIDVGTYLELLRRNDKALAIPDVIENLFYLYEAPYLAASNRAEFPKIFELQRAVIAKKQTELIEATENELKQQLQRITQERQKGEGRLGNLVKQLEEIDARIVQTDPKLREKGRLEARKASLLLERDVIQNYLAAMKVAEEGIREDLGVDGKGLGIANFKQQWQENLNTALDIRVVGKRFILMNDRIEDWKASADARQEIIRGGQQEIYANLLTHIHAKAGKAIRSELKKNPSFQFLVDMCKADTRSHKQKLKEPQPRSGSVTANIQKMSEDYVKYLTNQYFQQLLVKMAEKQGHVLKSGVDGFEENFWALAEVLGEATTLGSISDVLSHLDQEAAEWQPLKEAYITDMARTWVKHENPEFFQQLHAQKADSHAILVACRPKFQRWFEEKTGHKIIELKQTKFPIDLSPQILEKVIPSKEAIEKNVALKQSAAAKLGMFFKTLVPQTEKSEKKVRAQVQPVITRADFKSTEVVASSLFSGIEKKFEPGFDEKGLSLLSTVQFLRDHPVPVYDRTATALEPAFRKYEAASLEYLRALSENKGLDNRRERLIAFTNQALETLLLHREFAPSEKTLQAFTTALMEQCTYDHEKPLDEVIQTIENSERTELLKGMLTLGLLAAAKSGKLEVRQDFFLMAKQWERLLFPASSSLSPLIKQLNVRDGIDRPSDAFMENAHLIQSAILKSPVGLEALHEGVGAIQDTLHRYGKKVADPLQVRGMADRFEMRSGVGLITHNFLKYYPISNWNDVESREKLGSVQGREFFERVFYEAYATASPAEQKLLIKWMDTAIKNSQSYEAIKSPLKLPTSIFFKQIKQRLGIYNEQDAKDVQKYIDGLVSQESMQGQDRIFGFALTIRWNIAKLKKELSKEKPDQNLINHLYSEIACARLAYESLIEQASESVKEGFEHNFEYQRELHGALSEMREWNGQLKEWVKNLDQNGGAHALRATWMAYQAAKKMDGEAIDLGEQDQIKALDIEGFAAIQGIVKFNWDVAHGILYKGNSRSATLPATIKSDHRMQALNIQDLPFQKKGSAYVYAEDGEAQIIVGAKHGELIIQRRMPMLEGPSQMLQYMTYQDIQDLPACVRDRLGIQQFWIDKDHNIHGYDKNGKPCATILAPKHREPWRVVTAEGSSYQILTNPRQTPLLEKLQKVAGFHEILQSQEGYWIPSLGLTVLSAGNEKEGWKCRGGVYDGMRIFDEGDAGLVIARDLSPSDRERIEANLKGMSEATQKIKTLEEEMTSGAISPERTTLLREHTMAQVKQLIVHLKSENVRLESKLFLVRGKDSDSEALQKADIAYNKALNKVQESREKYLAEISSGGEVVLENWKALHSAREALVIAEKQLEEARMKPPPYFSYQIGIDTKLKPTSLSALFQMAGMNTEKVGDILQLLSSTAMDRLLTDKEMKDLLMLRDQFTSKREATLQDKEIVLMLDFLCMKHYQLAREATIRGKIPTWDRAGAQVAKHRVMQEGHELKEMLKGQPVSPALQELWQQVECELDPTEDLKSLLLSNPPNPTLGDPRAQSCGQCQRYAD